MKVLITGGRGKTALRLASLLNAADVPFLTTSRSGPSTSDPNAYPCVRFDWLDPTTHDALFAGTDVDRVYLVAPPVMDMVGIMTAFIDRAIRSGVTRFVLLSASTFDETGPAMGAVHKYIKSLGSGVEYCVLRPTWFMENLTEASTLSLRMQDDTIYSATGSGTIPWVSVDDIAAVAVHALTASPSSSSYNLTHNTDPLILGPALFSYADVAALISKAAGHTITHTVISEDALATRLSAAMPEEFARMLAALDTAISKGSEARTNDVVERVTGRAPKTLEVFVEENKATWAKDGETQ
ncbi:putative ergot alkaloid A [Athelia psychrophila]|uniref:Ergot alkaloid A n=1 Tax=Athelia psychrophila TaxID=1759441 RepID=A0A167TTP9_9AGAM|nr:putative ergot alkaloid A [Fibularhizoctonia sp. CBS 109695]